MTRANEKKIQKNFRLSPALIAKLAAHSESTGTSETKLVEAALEDVLLPPANAIEARTRFLVRQGLQEDHARAIAKVELGERPAVEAA